MAQGKRSQRVGDEILKEIATLLLERVKDPRVKDVTITGVSLTRDLKWAKVYFSTLGGDQDVDTAQAGLDSAKGYIKMQIGRRMGLRYVPAIDFVYDASLRVGSRMEQLLKTLGSDETEDTRE